jgi:ATPase family associated with various cellular activities (AAA)
LRSPGRSPILDGVVADESSLTRKEFGHLFKGFLEQAVESAPASTPYFLERLREHFGRDPSRLPTLREDVDKSDHPNLQLAIESYLAEANRRAELVGIMGGQEYREPSIATLLLVEQHSEAASEGPVQYENIRLADEQVLPCVARGLYLVTDDAKRYALLVASPNVYSHRENLRVEVMAEDRDDAVRLLAALRKAMRTRNVYRGQVVSLTPGHESLDVHFHRLRAITREDIVLPDGILERIERQTIGFSRHRDTLLAAGRHLKRGLLLYGPPGTGKTLTAMYLAARMKERTTLLLTGRGLGMVEQSCAMARLLQPSTIILEDVDLIAEERTRMGSGCTFLLFELLNQMDGLADDCDVVFLLTTNRPELLEPALASRPGRIDLAVEIPAPDPGCRRRLFDLYGRGLTLQLSDLDGLIDRTDGVSAAFIRELLRKAALIAADEPAPTITDHHLDAALHELAVQGGDLLRSLLGVRHPSTHSGNER